MGVFGKVVQDDQRMMIGGVRGVNGVMEGVIVEGKIYNGYKLECKV